MQYKSRTQHQRIQARKTALNAVKNLGNAKPQPEHFRHTQSSKYPQWLISTVITLSLIMLIATRWSSTPG